MLTISGINKNLGIVTGLWHVNLQNANFGTLRELNGLPCVSFFFLNFLKTSNALLARMLPAVLTI